MMKEGEGVRKVEEVDPAVIDWVRKIDIPLELVAKHGAMLEVQSKRAIKYVWKEKRYLRKVAKEQPQVAPVYISHAMVVQGKIKDKIFSNIIIDPGASKSLMDKRAAEKSGIEVVLKSKYIIQMINR